MSIPSLCELDAFFESNHPNGVTILGMVHPDGSAGAYIYNHHGVILENVTFEGFDAGAIAKKSNDFEVINLNTHDCEFGVFAEECGVVKVDGLNMTFSPKVFGTVRMSGQVARKIALLKI